MPMFRCNQTVVILDELQMSMNQPIGFMPIPPSEVPVSECNNACFLLRNVAGF
jgi:hypothetical protein